jgi:hypothetical protein
MTSSYCKHLMTSGDELVSIPADRPLMSAVMPELRTPVMTLVEASWEDSDGASQKITARMEDKSVGGACIRVKTPIRVGSKLRIQWRFDQFTGTVRYCRGEGREYLVGIQRDSVESPLPNRAPPTGRQQEKTIANRGSYVSAVTAQSVYTLQESKPNDFFLTERMAEEPPQHRAAAFSNPMPRQVIRRETNSMEDLRFAEPPLLSPPRPADPVSRPRKKQEVGEINKERKLMARKWIELAPWHSKQNAAAKNASRECKAGDDGSSDGDTEKENHMPHLNQFTEKAPVHTAREVPNFQVELLLMEDIYRMSGIMNPRRGYSISKVVEMVHSEHIRGLSKEMKQAAVLMALDAAGISLDQVQQDAKARQDALDSYEAAQKKQVEAMWARKAEEVIQIQAELDSVKAHHLARISRNLEGVAREKATFNNWLTQKQQECESMAEAVEMCLRSPAVSEPAIAPVAEINININKEKAVSTAAGGKPV